MLHIKSEADVGPSCSPGSGERAFLQDVFHASFGLRGALLLNVSCTPPVNNMRLG